jgi:hypothetical protein
MNEMKRAREPEPRSGSKQQKVDPSRYDSCDREFRAASQLADTVLERMEQSDIAGFCVAEITRLAGFMSEAGDEKYDWSGMLLRYATPGTTSDNSELERVLWNCEGFAGYIKQIEDLHHVFSPRKDYQNINVHLDHLEEAIQHYSMEINTALQPAEVTARDSLEHACTAFVNGLRGLCMKMCSMQDSNAPWGDLLDKFPSPGTKESSLTLEDVGVQCSREALRDIMATPFVFVSLIAVQLSEILKRVEDLQDKAMTCTRESRDGDGH